MKDTIGSNLSVMASLAFFCGMLIMAALGICIAVIAGAAPYMLAVPFVLFVFLGIFAGFGAYGCGRTVMKLSKTK
jgi:F0F1-type ATP synthase assembly protein I